MTDKPLCYKCRYRGRLPGDSHSCCRHPDLGAITGGLGKVKAIAEKFEIVANPRGIKMGWFFWPWNFDPVWLLNCNAYQEVEP